MKFLVTNEMESHVALTYFAHFHDGYIQTLTLRSHYETTLAGGNFFPGFDVVIVFSHSGYAEYSPPTRKIRAEFLDASDFCLKLQAIQSGTFVIDQAHINISPDGKFEFGIDFHNEFEEQVDATQWKWKRIFRFEKAIFSEE